MHKLKNYVLCTFVTVLLFFGMAGAQAAVIIKYSVLEPGVYHSILEENDVYDKTHSEIRKHFEREENATGIPADVYMEAVTKELVKELVNENISVAFSYINGKTEKPEFAASSDKLDVLKNSIDSFFEEYAASINYEKDDVYYEKTSSVYKNASSYILDTVDVYQFRTIDKAGYLSPARTVAGYADKLVICALGFVALMIVIIVVANIGRIANTFYWLGIASGSVSTVVLAVCIYLKTSGFYNRFAIKASHIFASITGACNRFTDILILVNAVLFVSGIIFMILFAFTAKEKDKKTA